MHAAAVDDADAVCLSIRRRPSVSLSPHLVLLHPPSVSPRSPHLVTHSLTAAIDRSRWTHDRRRCGQKGGGEGAEEDSDSHFLGACPNAKVIGLLLNHHSDEDNHVAF